MAFKWRSSSSAALSRPLRAYLRARVRRMHMLQRSFGQCIACKRARGVSDVQLILSHKRNTTVNAGG